jgi:hypothetical protein
MWARHRCQVVPCTRAIEALRPSWAAKGFHYMDLRNNLLLNEIPSPFRPLLEDDRNGLLVNNRAE